MRCSGFVSNGFRSEVARMTPPPGTGNDKDVGKTILQPFRTNAKPLCGLASGGAAVVLGSLCRGDRLLDLRHAANNGRQRYGRDRFDYGGCGEPGSGRLPGGTRECADHSEESP